MPVPIDCIASYTKIKSISEKLQAPEKFQYIKYIPNTGVKVEKVFTITHFRCKAEMLPDNQSYKTEHS